MSARARCAGRLRAAVLLAAAAFLATAPSSPAAASAVLPAVGDTTRAAFESAYDAWDAGDYVAALEGFLDVLASPGAERYLERIALITGELFETEPVAPDGRAVRFGPDGRLAAYEVPRDGAPLTRILRIHDDGVEHVAELHGHGFVFGPAGSPPAGVYRRVEESAELARARAELAEAVAARDRDAISRARGQAAWLAAESTRLVFIDLESGRERVLDAGGLIAGEAVFRADGGAVYVVATEPDSTHRTHIYELPLDGVAPARLTSGDGHRSNLLVTPDGRHLVYVLGGRSPLPAPPGPAQGGAGIEDRVVVHDLERDRILRAYPGLVPRLSADGSTLAFVAQSRTENRIDVVDLDDGAGSDPVTVERTRRPLMPAALSPDGRLLAFPTMTGVSWDLYVVGRDGAGARRLTENVQHEIAPHFLDGDRLLALMGEARHRRSHVYDMMTGARTRVFHNNTVRTIAPEYDWAASRDGSLLLVVADRDGDTIAPEQSITLVRLDRRVDVDAVRARLRRELETERALRARGAAMYAPVADRVRDVVGRVSADRLYEYQASLYGFGSKHITQPGNRPAGEYLHRTYASFGYEPRYQWFEPLDGVRTANVVAVLPGTENPALVYVISSHYDSVRESPGADDNSSGTAVLLETARVLAQQPLPATVVFASLTGEESGLLGAREFVRRAAELDGRIVGVLNNDMLGWTRDHRLDNTVRYSNAGIRDVQHAAAFLFSDLITYDAHYYRGTDAAVFYEAYGDIVGGIGSYPVLSNPNYHQSTDRLETINQRLVEATTRATVASIMLLASSPSRLTGLEVVRRDGDRVELRWDPSPERGTHRYTVAYGPPDDPLRHEITVAEPRATLTGVPAGAEIAVRAVNERGLHGWDWARTRLDILSVGFVGHGVR